MSKIALRRPLDRLTEQRLTFILNIIPLNDGAALRAGRGTDPSHSEVAGFRAGSRVVVDRSQLGRWCLLVLATLAAA